MKINCSVTYRNHTTPLWFKRRTPDFGGIAEFYVWASDAFRNGCIVTPILSNGTTGTPARIESREGCSLITNSKAGAA